MIKKLKANSVQIIEVMIMLIAFLLPYIEYSFVVWRLFERS